MASNLSTVFEEKRFGKATDLGLYLQQGIDPLCRYGYVDLALDHNRRGQPAEC